jgi:transcriptional regulator with XRE-family HTH domain
VEGDLQRSVGANIRQLRHERGLSQEQMAYAIGVHRTYLGGLERGERNVTLKAVERIADWLEVDPLVLLTQPRGGGS